MWASWGLFWMRCGLESLCTLPSGNRNYSQTCASLGIVWLSALTGYLFGLMDFHPTLALAQNGTLPKIWEDPSEITSSLLLQILPYGVRALQILESLELFYLYFNSANCQALFTASCKLSPGRKLGNSQTHLICFPSQGSPSPVLSDVQYLKIIISYIFPVLFVCFRQKGNFQQFVLEACFILWSITLWNECIMRTALPALFGFAGFARCESLVPGILHRHRKWSVSVFWVNEFRYTILSVCGVYFPLSDLFYWPWELGWLWILLLFYLGYFTESFC